MKNRMVRLKTLAGLAGSWLLLQGTAAYAACPSPVGESYNPYLIQGIVSPAPLLPVEFNGTGTLQFDVGNTGSTEVCVVNGEETRLVITLSKGVPDNVDPIAAVGGPGKAWFDWAYDAGTTTYTATQIAPIPPGGRAMVTIAYKLTQNSFLSAAPTTSNGLNVNLQPPAFTNGTNATDDDNVSSYTYVAASDYSDAPSTYGEVWHNVDVTRRIEAASRYLRYVRIGTVVDPETQMSYSPSAVGDDDSKTGGLNTDDEDGVTFPAMNPGQAGVTIPVSTVFASTTGMTRTFLHAWIDWDRSGTFEEGERITDPTDTFAYSRTTTGIISVPIDVPTVAQGWYVARFRFGPETDSNGDVFGPTGAADWGEVEDHMFPVGNPTAVTMGDVDLIATGVPAFLRDVGANDRDTAGLLALLRSWDPAAAAKLQRAGRDVLLKALRDYLDPDGDGQVVVFRWETLEERGTIGFYVDRGLHGQWQRINAQMLPGLIASPMGAQYWLADPGAQVGDDYQYRLIEVEARGGTNEYGPFDLRTTTP